jgi:PPOX class probable F420-dependent enzyme
MPSRRDLIRMTDEEMRDFIESRKSLQVATLDKGGAPHLTTLWFALIDGEIVFETFTKSQKIRNLERDPRIAVLLEDGLAYNELRGVSITGHAELTTDPDVLYAAARVLVRRNQPEIPEQAVDDAARMMCQKRTLVRVKPERTMTWDHRKLAGRY